MSHSLRRHHMSPCYIKKEDHHTSQVSRNASRVSQLERRLVASVRGGGLCQRSSKCILTTTHIFFSLFRAQTNFFFKKKKREGTIY